MISLSSPSIGEAEINAVVKVLKSGMLVQGEVALALESKFARFCGTKYAVAFNSGTAAIHAGLYAFGITTGDEVITTPFTFVATANPILMQGGRVIFADISENDFNIDPKSVERHITNKTKAIIPVDLFGQIYNYEEIKRLSCRNNLKILEDACQAHGAEHNGKKAGTFGDIGAFSLYATKNMMSGEGGLITTDDSELMERCRIFRHHGQSEKNRYEYIDLGYNYRTTDICSAIAVEQLKKLNAFNLRRINNATRLSNGLRGIKGLVLPTIAKGDKHVFHQYTVRVTREFKTSREEFMSFLKEMGIGCGVYYPKPLHLHPHFMKMGYKMGDFPVAERISTEVLSLPVNPNLRKKDIDYIISSIKKYVKI